MNPMHLPLAAIAWAVLLGGWTFMWLKWSFAADVRSWIAALVFPRSWRPDKTRAELASLSAFGFGKWLAASSRAPAWVCQLMSCRYCWSAHVASSGTLLLLLHGDLPLLVLPLVWATGAGIGNIIYALTDRPPPTH